MVQDFQTKKSEVQNVYRSIRCCNRKQTHTAEAHLSFHGHVTVCPAAAVSPWMKVECVIMLSVLCHRWYKFYKRPYLHHVSKNCVPYLVTAFAFRLPPSPRCHTGVTHSQLRGCGRRVCSPVHCACGLSVADTRRRDFPLAGLEVQALIFRSAVFPAQINGETDRQTDAHKHGRHTDKCL